MRRILLVRTDRIGDVLLSLPAAPAIKAAFPDAKITLFCRTLTRVIGERNPSIDDIITIDDEAGSRKSFISLVRRIRREQFDCAIFLHPEPYLALLIACAGIPIRVGTAYRYYSFLFNIRRREHRKKSIKHEVDYNLGLLGALDIPAGKPRFDFEIFEKDEQHAAKALADAGIVRGRRYCVVHPGSGGSAMDWPVDSYAAVIKLFGNELKLSTVLTWGAGEEELVQNLALKAGDAAHPLKEILPLPALAALLKIAEFTLAPSTGVLHIANVTGAPVIGIYPDVPHMSPTRWGPYGNLQNAITPGSTNPSAGISVSADDPEIMRLITPEMVLSKARAICSK